MTPALTTRCVCVGRGKSVERQKANSKTDLSAKTGSGRRPVNGDDKSRAVGDEGPGDDDK